MLAIQAHDNGWQEVDAEPCLDPATGRVLDFVHVPEDVRHAVWRRGVARLGGEPYAAALVAQHALHIYRRMRQQPGWRQFFVDMTAARDQHLRGRARDHRDVAARVRVPAAGGPGVADASAASRPTGRRRRWATTSGSRGRA